MLLPMSSKLMNQYYGTCREKKRKFADLYIKLLWKNAEATSGVYDEAMEKMEMWLN